jgi:hypothetical protein
LASGETVHFHPLSASRSDLSANMPAHLLPRARLTSSPTLTELPGWLKESKT